MGSDGAINALINATEQSIGAVVAYYESGYLTGPCLNVDPEYLAHLNLPVQAHDLDIVRNLTGYDVFNFMGFIDGGLAGVAYATMFPDRIGKIVLDGIAPCRLW